MSTYRVDNGDGTQYGTDLIADARRHAASVLIGDTDLRSVPVFYGRKCGWVIRETLWIEWIDFMGERYSVDAETGSCRLLRDGI